MKKPKVNLGQLVDQVYKLQQQRDVIRLKVGKLDEQIDQLKDKLLAATDKESLSTVKTKLAKTVIRETVVPTVEDFDQLLAYIRKHKAWELLTKRVASEAYRERVEAGERVPGVKPFHKITLSVVTA